MNEVRAKFFTVIVPVYEDWKVVYENLNLFKNLVCENVDVVFVDNGSEVIPDGRNLLPCRLLICEKEGSYAARNLGIEGSRETTHFIFTDADCKPDGDWLNCLIDASAESPSSVIAGEIVQYSLEKKCNMWSAYDSVFSLDQKHYVQRGCAATANLLIPSRLFTKYGSFPETSFSGGDIQYTTMLTSLGVDLRFCEDAKVYHPIRSNRIDVLRKIKRIVGGQLTRKDTKKRILYFIMNILFIFTQSIKLYFKRKRCSSLRHYFLVQLIIPYLAVIILLEITKFSILGTLERR